MRRGTWGGRPRPSAVAFELARGVASLPRSIPTAALVVGIGMLLASCSKVNVTPLGSTSEGRRQFELTCSQRASDNGSCHDKAMHACRGDYETLDVDNTGPRVDSYSGQIFTAPGYRVLLIACNR